MCTGLGPDAPGLPSRLPSTHTPWSRRGAGRPGGARHCTNDLDARCRVCSALPGSTADGMGAPTATPNGRHPLSEPPPSRSLSAPAGGIVLSRTRVPPRPHRGFVTHQPEPSGVRTAARLERGADRSAGPDAGPRAPRRARRVRLDEVEKVLSRCGVWSLRARSACTSWPCRRSIPTDRPGTAVVGDSSGGWVRMRTPHLTLRRAVNTCNAHAHRTPEIPALDAFRPVLPPLAKTPAPAAGAAPAIA